MKVKHSVFFILVLSIVFLQRCSLIQTSKANQTPKREQIKNILPNLTIDSAKIYKDSIAYYKNLLQKHQKEKVEAIPKKDSVRIETKIVIDSTNLHLYKDSLRLEKINSQLLNDSLKSERSKLLDAYLKYDTLILKTKHIQMFEAKILSLQKQNNPKILYKLIPYKVVEKDLQAVVVTALTVCFVMLGIFFFLWKKYIKTPLSRIEVSEKEKEILEKLKDEEFSL